MASALRENGLYRLQRTKTYKSCIANVWHRIMGHIGQENLKKLKSMVRGMEKVDGSDEKGCEICLKGKQSRFAFPSGDSRANEKLELMHTDLCGPMNVASLGGSLYFLTFIDDFTRKTFVYTIKSKNMVLKKFKEFKSRVENQTGKKIKILRSDNGREYCNKPFDDFLVECGVVRQLSAPYSPQQNGLSERMNRSIVEKARCMLFDANSPEEFWAEAVLTAVHLINHSPARGTGKTPQELWYDGKPDLSHFRVFGCQCMAHIPKVNRKKFDPKSEKCIFMGYSEESKAYRLYKQKTSKIIVSRDVVFFEDKFVNLKGKNPEENGENSESYTYIHGHEK